MATFAISEGWNVSTPKPIQRRAPLAELADARNKHDDQQEKGNIQQDLPRAPQALIVEAADNKHHRCSQHGEHRLPLKVIHRIVLGWICLVIGGGKAGRKQNHKADGGQQQHQQAEGQVNGSLCQLPALLHFLSASCLRSCRTNCS